MAEKKSSKNTGKKTNRATKTANAGSKNNSVESIEDRMTQRIPVQLLVDYRSDGNYLFDFCKDLGAGGVFIQSKTPLANGSSVNMTFTLPDSKETLKATGKVMWVQNAVNGRKDLTPGMGVQFSDFSKQDRKKLEDFLKRFQSGKSPTSETSKSA